MVKKVNQIPALTFDDVLLVPGYADFLPQDAVLSTKLSSSVGLGIPFISAAMDTVTESKLATTLALEGGLGIIHKNLSIQDQANEVILVKRHQSGVITKPITASVEQSVLQVRQISKQHNISALPIVDGDLLVGLVTNRDLKYVENDGLPITEVMTPFDKLITINKFNSQRQVRLLMHENRIERVLIVSKDGKLLGMVTETDIQKIQRHPYSTTDKKGRLRVGAAVGPNDNERIESLIDAGVDVVTVDTAHGHSKSVISMCKWIRKHFPKICLIAGNIATADAAKALVKTGVDAVKVGIGPGSICTTRIVAGIGVPQITAIMDVVKAIKKSKVKVIADGGIRYSGDIVKALAAGADAVMIGNLFAGTAESPGVTESYQGKYYKNYRGMGSLGALAGGSADRYFQSNISSDKFVPEGIEGRIPYQGEMRNVLSQLVGGLKSGMGYCGTKTLKELSSKSIMISISKAALTESHVHDITITKEAPNYNL